MVADPVALRGLGADDDRQPSSGPAPTEHLGRPVRVLLADDSEDVRLVLGAKLRRDGRFEVVGEACDGAEAVDLAAALQPDLVLLDLAMPVKDGLQALPRIRQRSPGSMVVVLSGIVADRFVTKALELGAAGYVPKAGDAGILLDTLNKLFPRAVARDPHSLLGHVDRGAAGGGIAAYLRDEVHRNVLDIIECTATVREQATDPHAVRAAAASIERSARQVHEQLGRAEALTADAPTYSETVDLAELVRELTLDLRLTIDPHPLEVLTSGRCVILGDLLLMRRGVGELLTNAARHTPPNTPIEITVTARAEDVAVVILDRGPGLPEEVVERVHDDHRTDGVSPRKGIGLALARNVAWVHGGQLTFDRPEHGGARFTLTLPVTPDA